jgi:hypothetical protein
MSQTKSPLNTASAAANPAADSGTPPSRRGFLLAASMAGAVGAAATVVVVNTPGAPEAVAEVTPPAPANGGGYHLSEHVKHYYRTTRV